MKVNTPVITYLKDYTPVNYCINSVNLHFDVFDEYVLVENTMNISLSNQSTSISLYGSADLECLSIKVNQIDLPVDCIEREAEILKLKITDKNFSLSIITKIYPKKNFSLNGLYFSGGSYFTQNEPHGFRQITFYGDRPDVMSIFKTKITASKDYKYLLSNGNPVEKGVDKNNVNRCYVIWHDPFPKPCYLFAIVIGNFDVLKDKFVTKNNRSIDLEIYVDLGKTAYAEHAMESLKTSMKWDEDKYDLEYDLDIYMIVAAESFNMGAMENKGLNIFNSKYILGSLISATDEDLEAIEAVVAHEYFHNWTGNRVTCRDWFQLTLKEGLTVFRDQQFTADQHGEVVKRIKDVQLLRQRQFEEDAGPLSHPIRPTSYVEMNNFYTATVYEKGAEVIRMLHTIVGQEQFKLSLKTYFELYDGKAATVENFIHAFEITTKKDFSGFMHWYETKGTPIVKVIEEKTEPGSIKLTLEQNWLENQNEKLVELPLKIAWPTTKGLSAFDLNLVHSQNSKIIYHKNNEALFLLADKKNEIVFTFPNSAEDVALSFNRGFTSPINVKNHFNLSKKQLIAKYDTDLFNKWDACQEVISFYVSNEIKNGLNIVSNEFTEVVADLWKFQLITREQNDYFCALFLALPSEDELNEKFNHYHFAQIRNLCLSLIKNVSQICLTSFQEEFYKIRDDEIKWTAKDMGARKLKNTLLDYLIAAGDVTAVKYAMNSVKDSINMNQQIYALCSLNRYNCLEAAEANEIFINKNKTSSLLVDKWFIAQMSNLSSDSLQDKVVKLMGSPYFDIKIPNRVYSLIIRWMGNLASFNHPQNPGYALVSDIVREIDQFNPQVASRILKSFKSPVKMPTELKKKLHLELDKIYQSSNLSKDSLEIVEKLIKG